MIFQQMRESWLYKMDFGKYSVYWYPITYLTKHIDLQLMSIFARVALYLTQNNIFFRIRKFNRFSSYSSILSCLTQIGSPPIITWACNHQNEMLLQLRRPSKSQLLMTMWNSSVNITIKYINDILQSNMIPILLTALTGRIPQFTKKRKIRGIFRNKSLKKNIYQTFNVSTSKSTRRINLNKSSTNTALKHFKFRAMAEISYHFAFDGDQERETQPIYLSIGESENTTPCSTPRNQLPNNVPDSYDAITQLIASQHQQMSAPRNLPYNTHPPHQLRLYLMTTRMKYSPQ